MKSWMFLNSLISTVSAPVVRAQVMAVHSGSHLEILSEGTVAPFRIQGVACFDPAFPAGMAARDYAALHTYMNDVTLEISGYDVSGVTVGKIRLGNGADLGEALVHAGLAWWNREEAPADLGLAAWEADARSAKRGIWAEAELASENDIGSSTEKATEFARQVHSHAGLTDLYFSSAAPQAC